MRQKDGHVWRAKNVAQICPMFLLKFAPAAEGDEDF